MEVGLVAITCALLAINFNLNKLNTNICNLIEAWIEAEDEEEDD